MTSEGAIVSESYHDDGNSRLRRVEGIFLIKNFKSDVFLEIVIHRSSFVDDCSNASKVSF